MLLGRPTAAPAISRRRRPIAAAAATAQPALAAAAAAATAASSVAAAWLCLRRERGEGLAHRPAAPIGCAAAPAVRRRRSPPLRLPPAAGAFLLCCRPCPQRWLPRARRCSRGRPAWQKHMIASRSTSCGSWSGEARGERPGAASSALELPLLDGGPACRAPAPQTSPVPPPLLCSGLVRPARPAAPPLLPSLCSAGTYIVGIAGVPGSGKSSLAAAVCERLNAAGVAAANVPMDGFHYYRRVKFHQCCVQYCSSCCAGLSFLGAAQVMCAPAVLSPHAPAAPPAHWLAAWAPKQALAAQIPALFFFLCVCLQAPARRDARPAAGACAAGRRVDI